MADIRLYRTSAFADAARSRSRRTPQMPLLIDESDALLIEGHHS
jgi:hypothetical protein